MNWKFSPLFDTVSVKIIPKKCLKYITFFGALHANVLNGLKGKKKKYFKGWRGKDEFLRKYTPLITYCSPLKNWTINVLFNNFKKFT